MLPYKHFFFTVKKTRQGRNVKLAMALDGDRVIYCRGRLRKKFIHQFDNYEEHGQYMSMLYDKSGVDNMVSRQYRKGSE